MYLIKSKRYLDVVDVFYVSIFYNKLVLVRVVLIAPLCGVFLFHSEINSKKILFSLYVSYIPVQFALSIKRT